MKVKLKIFPISGMNSTARLLEVEIKEGATVADLLCMAERITGNRIPDTGVMVMLSGIVIDRCKYIDTSLEAADWLWIMPTLCGG